MGHLLCSFDDAVRGATFVFHTASPFVMKVSRGAEREQLIDPAVKGTENIIGARPMRMYEPAAGRSATNHRWQIMRQQRGHVVRHL